MPCLAAFHSAYASGQQRSRSKPTAQSEGRGQRQGVGDSGPEVIRPGTEATPRARGPLDTALRDPPATKTIAPARVGVKRVIHDAYVGRT